MTTALETATLEATSETTDLEFCGETDLQCDDVTGQASLTAADGSGVREFDVVAYTGGDLHVGLYPVPAVVDLGGLQASETWPMLLDHKLHQRVGHTSDTHNDGRQLRHKGHASVPGEHRDKVVEAAANEYPWQVSIGVRVLEAERVPAGRTFRANGRTFQGPRVWVKRSRMKETSFVTVGADAGGASATLAAAYHEEMLRAEQSRIDSIQAVCGRYTAMTHSVDDQDKITAIQAHAIDEGWDALQTELEALRASRGSAPAVHVRNNTASGTLQAIEGAMILRAGVALDHKAFGSRAAHALGVPKWLTQGVNDDGRQRVMENAHRFSDRSLVDIAAEAVRLDGGDPYGNRNDTLKAAFSGGSLERIFSTSINARVLASYGEAKDTTRDWCREVEVNDFRQVEASRLSESGSQLEKLPRGGEIAETAVSDMGETYRLARYAKAWTVDEQDIIDDRFDLLDDVPDQMARAAARMRPDLVYAHLLSNPMMSNGHPLFSEEHGNILRDDGPDGDVPNPPLSIEAIEAAKVQLALMQENGVTLDFESTDILVPTCLESHAKKLLESQEIRGPGADGGILNPAFGVIANIIAEARLANGVRDPDQELFAAGSRTGFYVFDRHHFRMLVAYLAGTGRAPQVRSHRYQSKHYGFRHEVSLDIGVRAITSAPILRSQPA